MVDRYYDPNNGQFISLDPLVATTGQPYSYAGGDPVNATDPTGLSASGLQLIADCIDLHGYGNCVRFFSGGRDSGIQKTRTVAIGRPGSRPSITLTVDASCSGPIAPGLNITSAGTLEATAGGMSYSTSFPGLKAEAFTIQTTGPGGASVAVTATADGWSCSMSRDWSANVGLDTLDINATATVTYTQKPGDGNSWLNPITDVLEGAAAVGAGAVAVGSAIGGAVSDIPPWAEVPA